MRRRYTDYLKTWFHDSSRKPLLLRGARQVGKTWLARNLAESEGLLLVEFNFERSPELITLFDSNNPHQILKRIEQQFSITIDPQKTLLFLDEVQAKPELIAKLRWFYEDMPELAIIAAGSLLEFVLGVAPISMPVGRISFGYVEPLSFIEFLQAQNKDPMVELIQTYEWSQEIPAILHDELMKLFKEYVFIGGLPAAVASWSTVRSIEKIKEVHNDLLGTYRADFSKYSARLSPEVLNDVIDAIPLSLAHKFVYSHVETDASLPKIKTALNLLNRARIAHKVKCTAANGIPLGAEVNNKYLKVILLDVGLCSSLLGLKLFALEDIEELTLINKGGIAEQAAGQLLRTINPFYMEPSLYYWTRTEKGAEAEVDYIIQYGGKVMPVEVKSGSSGALRSLHYFMQLKKLKTAVRISSGQAQITDVAVQDAHGNEITYELRSFPFYLISEIHRLLD